MSQSIVKNSQNKGMYIYLSEILRGIISRGGIFALLDWFVVEVKSSAVGMRA